MADANARSRNAAARLCQTSGRGGGGRQITRSLESIFRSGRVLAGVTVVLPRPVLLGPAPPDVCKSEQPTAASVLRTISVSSRNQRFRRAEEATDIRRDA